VPTDRDLIQIVDAALADCARKNGSWLACRPGCDHCCYGPFEITQLDAERLQQGLRDLEQSDPSRAARLLERVRAAHTTKLSDDDPCPVLDPDSRTCDLYYARPITCRAFGPPVQCHAGIGICELCFVGASDDVIAANIVDLDPDNLESVLIEELAQSTGLREMTTVARCLLR
jgi:Fe-S-cluster containining protein